MKTQTTTETTDPRHCLCGCGDAVTGKSRFRAGHDQRLVSSLATELVDGGGSISAASIELLGVDSGAVVNSDIEDAIRTVVARVGEVLSPGLAAKVDKAARRRWEKAGRGVVGAPTNARVEPTVDGAPAKPITGSLGECEGTTKAGKRCKRRTESDSRFCHAHREETK
ncbi:MAG TPA: hypothetical protein VGP26_14570 [Actinophytocola sp.]|jgi:hypothetical protein|nr:hypothetical protein [Actinophytocola sp.]